MISPLLYFIQQNLDEFVVEMLTKIGNDAYNNG